MVTMSDRALGQVYDLPPLPPFVRADELLADSLPLLDAPSRISPTEAAERYVRVETRGVWQNYDRDVTPYMVEPVDTAQSRLYKAGAFVGPSQSGKTLALITASMHPVTCDPAPVLIVHMDRPSRDRWVEESLNPVIQNSPDLRDRMGRGRDDDTFSRKRFRGMRMMLGYPTPQWLSSAKYRMVMMTDFDHFPPELGVRKDAPEGSAFDMGMQRIKTFLSRGYVFAESTPAWPVRSDVEWSPRKDAPHEFPPVKHGIVPLYNRGTRGRWYWECPDCGKMFEPRFDRLHFDPDAPPVQAGEAAEMECPHCHCLIGPHHKTELNRAALGGKGGWLHEAEHGGDLLPLGDSRIRGTEIASWSLNGAAATFANWSDMVARYLDAARQADELDDDLALGRFYYTDVGVPFARVGAGDDDDLSPRALKEDRTTEARGVAPNWVRFITVSVDVQGTYFTVQVTGWGLDGTRTVIDRFDLIAPPGAKVQAGQRKLDPAKYPGDWAVLDDLGQCSWPVRGAGFSLRALALGVDFHGAPGVSDNAEEFWLGRRAAGEGPRWFLTRGHGGFSQRDRVWFEAPGRSNQKKARRIKLLNMATDRLKDSVTAALLRPVSTPRSFPLPEFLSDDHVAEFCAEVRGDKGWCPKPGQKRNESLDLSVQAQALAEYKGLRRINPESPPNWATLGDENPFAIPADADQREKPAPAPSAPVRINFLKR